MRRSTVDALLRPLALGAFFFATAASCTLIVPFDDYRRPVAPDSSELEDVVGVDVPSVDAPIDNCLGDVCVPAPGPGELVLPTTNARALAVRPNDLYVLTEGESDGGPAGFLHRSLPDGAAPTVLASTPGVVSRPYLVGNMSGPSGSLFWIGGSQSSAKVYRFFDGGGAASYTSGANSGVRAITFDGTRLFFLRSTSGLFAFSDLQDASADVQSIPVTNGLPLPTASIASYAAPDTIMMTGGSEVREIQKDGTPVNTRAAMEDSPQKIVVDDVVIAWINAPVDPNAPLSAISGIRRKDRSGAAVETVQVGRAVDLVLDESAVYWIEHDGSVFVARHGSKAVLKLAQGPSPPFAIATSTEHVYWTAPDGVHRTAKLPR